VLPTGGSYDAVGNPASEARKSRRDCKDHPWEAWMGIAMLQVSRDGYSSERELSLYTLFTGLYHQ